ncbi:MAG: pantoate--beta-alanine ligase [Planctomycetes bacterium]|nr:pantoate--beta-alanine ligase [Planctomycetota bacterium]
MKVFSKIEACYGAVRDVQRRGGRVGLVPTMGALHQGHVSLIEAARRRCGSVAVTIFVNPTQFGPDEDFEKYPQPLEADLAACEASGVDIVFTPSVETLYPRGFETTIHVSGLTEGLCGAHRPGHFDGVTTIVAKLLNILPAEVAFFGEKDYQQFLVIRRMVCDLNLPIEIAACPIVREKDGLACSSRNRYLSPSERSQAAVLSRALFSARDRIAAGHKRVKELVTRIRAEILTAGPAKIDYVEIVDAETLDSLTEVDRPARIVLAARIGPCRLIDNVAVKE